MDGAKPPLLVTMDFIANAKWPLLLYTKNQAICNNILLLLPQMQMF